MYVGSKNKKNGAHCKCTATGCIGTEAYIHKMWMKSVDEDCREEKAIFLNATECYDMRKEYSSCCPWIMSD